MIEVYTPECGETDPGWCSTFHERLTPGSGMTWVPSQHFEEA